MKLYFQNLTQDEISDIWERRKKMALSGGKPSNMIYLIILLLPLFLILWLFSNWSHSFLAQMLWGGIVFAGYSSVTLIIWRIYEREISKNKSSIEKSALLLVAGIYLLALLLLGTIFVLGAMNIFSGRIIVPIVISQELQFQIESAGLAGAILACICGWLSAKNILHYYIMVPTEKSPPENRNVNSIILQLIPLTPLVIVAALNLMQGLVNFGIIFSIVLFIVGDILIFASMPLLYLVLMLGTWEIDQISNTTQNTPSK